jgi:hypothetical protein
MGTNPIKTIAGSNVTFWGSQSLLDPGHSKCSLTHSGTYLQRDKHGNKKQTFGHVFLLALGFWIHTFMLVRQALRSLNHTSSPFLLWLFLRWGLTNFFPQMGMAPWFSWSQPPAKLEWQVHTIAPSCWLRWGFSSFLPSLNLNRHPPDLGLPSS